MAAWNAAARGRSGQCFGLETGGRLHPRCRASGM